MLSITIRNNASQNNTIIMSKNTTIAAAIEEAGVNVGNNTLFINGKPLELFRCGVDATFESIGFDEGEHVSIDAVKMTNNAR